MDSCHLSSTILQNHTIIFGNPSIELCLWLIWYLTEDFFVIGNSGCVSRDVFITEWRRHVGWLVAAALSVSRDCHCYRVRDSRVLWTGAVCLWSGKSDLIHTQHVTAWLGKFPRVAGNYGQRRSPRVCCTCELVIDTSQFTRQNEGSLTQASFKWRCL